MQACSARTQVSWRDIDKGRFFSAGSVLGCGARVVLYPTEMLKTRLQMQGGGNGAGGTCRACIAIVRQEGPAAFYKGVSPALFTVAGLQAYLATLSMSRNHLQSMGCFSRVSVDVIAASTATLASQLLSSPAEIVSQKMRMDGVGAAAGTAAGGGRRRRATDAGRARDVFRRVWAESGVRGFYRGFGAQFMSKAPGHGIFWAAYQPGQDLLHTAIDAVTADAAAGDIGEHALIPCGAERRGHSAAREGAVQAASGVVSAVLAVLATNPINVLKTRL
jgi:hypothetical protein